MGLTIFNLGIEFKWVQVGRWNYQYYLYAMFFFGAIEHLQLKHEVAISFISYLPLYRDSDILLICSSRNHIASLDLSQCTELTDVSIKLISENMPSLTSLQLQGCTSLTEHCLRFIGCGCFANLTFSSNFNKIRKSEYCQIKTQFCSFQGKRASFYW